MPPGPVRDLKDVVYELYLRAGTPTLDEIEAEVEQLAETLTRETGGHINDVDAVIGFPPRRDTIAKIIGGEETPPSRDDTVTVAVALARLAGQLPARPGLSALDAVARQVRELWERARKAPPALRLGRPIAEYSPFDLEVHRAIDPTDQADTRAGELLPQYVPRAHDAHLADVVTAVMGGASRIAVLVGGSSTGKTRACWEAVQRLKGRWRLWHPIDPSRPDAAVRALAEVGPYTVVWLNEAQHYLLTADPATGERIAAGLRELLRDRDRGPVLVLCTLWREYWQTLTAAPPGVSDVHDQARHLLAGVDITVPEAFTAADLAAVAEAARTDVRLAHAAAHADAGRITQHLAGVPALLERYRNASPAARAVIEVAMDGRRLGHPLAIPYALLERAASGYLDDYDWDHAGEDWLEQALAYTARPCKGFRGLLTRIRTRAGDPPAADGQPCYRLADYLEQTGRTERAGIYPPDSLWTALTTTVSDPDLLLQLGRQAEVRGRYQHAIWLYTRAADRGDTTALRDLARRRERAGDAAGAEALYRQAADRGDSNALWDLAGLREQAGDAAGAEALYRQAADRGDTTALRKLARLREQAGDAAGAEALAVQAADCGDTTALWGLAGLRERAGDTAGAEALYRQAADRGDTTALRDLARLREQAGDAAGAEALAVQAADCGDTTALWDLARLREQAGDAAGAEALYRQAADRGDTTALWDLARRREQAGDAAGAEALAVQAADCGDTFALWGLAGLRERAGDTAGAEALYRQAADRGDTTALLDLAGQREQAGDIAGAEALAVQAADRGDTFVLRKLAGLRERAGDAAGAEALYRQAADRGDTFALWDLAGLRERAGDAAGAEALYRQAADRGDTTALRDLARLREQAGDAAGAEALYRQAADRGDTFALWDLAGQREQAGGRLIRLFGLTGAGGAATLLDFGSYGGLVSA